MVGSLQAAEALMGSQNSKKHALGMDRVQKIPFFQSAAECVRATDFL